MAIEAELIRIKSQELERLIKNPTYEYEEVRQRSFLGAYWQMIHYILTGEVGWPGRSFLPAPLCNIVLGGKLLYGEVDDTVRYLSPSEVKGVAEFLKEHSMSWVEKEFYKIKKRHVIIYYGCKDGYGSGMYEENLPEILSKYECLCSIYFEAAEADDVMLIRIG